MCCADFNFYLNRQGIRGRKGEKGDKGFSPSISIGQNTQEVFTLSIQNEFETFETPNLKEGLVPEDRGGTYVRKDSETGLEYYGEADAASVDNVGVIRIATQEEVDAGEDSGKAVTPETLSGKIVPINNEIQTIKAQVATNTSDIQINKENIEANAANIDKNTDTITENTFDIQTNKADIAAIKSGMQGVSTDLEDVKNSLNTLSSNVGDIQADVGGLESNVSTIQADISEINTNIESLTQDKQNRLIQGDNITLTDNDDGTTTISASGGGGGGGTGDVTAAGDNVFTGNNRFNKPITVDGGATIGQDTRDNASIALTVGGMQRLALLYSQGLVYTTSMGAPITLVDTDGTLILPKATTYSVGGIRVGSNLSIDGNGILSADVSSSDIEGLNSQVDGISSKVTSLEGKVITATTSNLGLVKPDGTTVTIDADGTIHAAGGGSAPDNMVTTDTDQTIDGRKTFSTGVKVTGGLTSSSFYGSDGDVFTFFNNAGNANLLKMSYIRTTGVKWETDKILTLNAVNYKFASQYWTGGLNIAGDTLTFTKTDGSVVDLLASGGGTPANMVTTDTEQIISGQKTISSATSLLFSANDGNSSHACKIQAKWDGSAGRAYLAILPNMSVSDMGVVDFNNMRIRFGSPTSSVSLTGSWLEADSSDQSNLKLHANKFNIDTEEVYLNNNKVLTTNDLSSVIGGLKYAVVTNTAFEGMSKDADTLYRVTTGGTTTAVYLGDIKLSA